MIAESTGTALARLPQTDTRSPPERETHRIRALASAHSDETRTGTEANEGVRGGAAKLCRLGIGQSQVGSGSTGEYGALALSRQSGAGRCHIVRPPCEEAQVGPDSSPRGLRHRRRSLAAATFDHRGVQKHLGLELEAHCLAEGGKTRGGEQEGLGSGPGPWDSPPQSLSSRNKAPPKRPVARRTARSSQPRLFHTVEPSDRTR